jgi:hypothetical protein
LKIIEKKASKPHTVYRCGGRLQLSYAITIPKPFALEMGLDEEDSYVLSHLVIASDDGSNSAVDFTAEQAAEKVIMSPPGNGEKKRKRSAKKFSHSEHIKGRRVYLVVEKLMT